MCVSTVDVGMLLTVSVLGNDKSIPFGQNLSNCNGVILWVSKQIVNYLFLYHTGLLKERADVDFLLSFTGILLKDIIQEQLNSKYQYTINSTIVPPNLRSIIAEHCKGERSIYVTQANPTEFDRVFFVMLSHN